MSKCFSFIITDGHKVEIGLTLRQLSLFPDKISDKLFESNKYEVQSNVQEAVFKEFIDHFLDNNNPLDINESNILQIQFLNEEFEVPSDLQSIPELSEAYDLSVLSQFNSEENHDKSIFEKYISQSIDKFLENHADKLYCIPITSLYNIFNHNDRQLNNHNIAYKFITNTLMPEGNSNFNPNFFILLQSLDASKLSKENIDDCISKRNDHFLYMPQNFDYICEFKNDKNNELTDDMIVNGKTAFKELLEIKKNSIASANLPFNLYLIPYSFFRDCTNLVDVVIPSSVLFIGVRAFFRCSNLKKVEFQQPSLLKTINGSAFEGCSSLVDFVIPSSVTRIEQNAFCQCSSLKEMTIPSSITTIDDDVFRSCSSLTKITIPSSVTIIENCSFYQCSSLVNIEIPSSVIIIGDSAFCGCKSLKEISIPSSVISIGSSAFSSCTSLKNVSIPSSVFFIGYGCFSGCSSLIEIDLSHLCLLEIGSNFFDDCQKLQKVHLPSSIKSLGDGIFYNCCSLKEIEIPSSVVSIGGFAFYSCSSLTKIVVPSSVNSIGPAAFIDCSSLRELEIHSPSVVFTPNYAFVNICQQVKIHSSLSFPQDIFPSTVSVIRTY